MFGRSLAALCLGFAIGLASLFGGCASTPATSVLSTPVTLGAASPEAQLLTGINTVTTTYVLTTQLLANHIITVPQAVAYRNMLVAAEDSLKVMHTELVACRASTPTPSSGVDPCWPKVSDVATIALGNVASIRKTLNSK